MESHLKKRLIGALVTVLFVAILLPWFIEKQQNTKEIEVDIPAMPKLPAWTDIKDKESVRVDLGKLARNNQKQKQVKTGLKTATEKTNEQKPAHILDSDEQAETSKTKPKTAFLAWSLKVGAFKNEVNANKLKSALNKEGFKAYSKRLNGYTRVYVGPEIKKQNITKAKSIIERKFKLKKLPIIRYKP